VQANRKRPPRPHREVHVITNEDILNKGFPLEKTPKLADLTQFLPDEGIEQRFGVDFTVVGNQVSWANLELEQFTFLLGDKIELTYYI